MYLVFRFTLKKKIWSAGDRYYSTCLPALPVLWIAFGALFGLVLPGEKVGGGTIIATVPAVVLLRAGGEKRRGGVMGRVDWRFAPNVGYPDFFCVVVVCCLYDSRGRGAVGFYGVERFPGGWVGG